MEKVILIKNLKIVRNFVEQKYVLGDIKENVQYNFVLGTGYLFGSTLTKPATGYAGAITNPVTEFDWAASMGSAPASISFKAIKHGDEYDLSMYYGIYDVLAAEDVDRLLAFSDQSQSSIRVFLAGLSLDITEGIPNNLHETGLAKNFLSMGYSDYEM